MYIQLENGHCGSVQARPQLDIAFRDGSVRGIWFERYGADWIAREVSPGKIALFESGQLVGRLNCELDSDKIMREYFTVLDD